MKLVLWATIAVVAVGALCCGSLDQPAYVATLSGSNEVPSVRTKAKGEATFTVNRGATAVDYKLVVSDIEEATEARIHVGDVGKNGPVVVSLYRKPGGETPKDGVFARGKISIAELAGPMKGRTIPELIRAMSSGDTYVNVSTKAHPDGEIRGHITASPAPAGLRPAL